jgi:hypothetical protein
VVQDTKNPASLVNLKGQKENIKEVIVLLMTS